MFSAGGIVWPVAHTDTETLKIFKIPSSSLFFIGNTVETFLQ